MLSPELLIDTAARVNQWVNAHLDDIVAAMKQASMTRIFEDILAYEDIPELFRPEKRTFSEMPVCDHFWSHLNPPHGFQIVPWSIGRVNIVGPSTKLALYSINHTYAQSPDGVILCITPGQFEVFTRTDLYAGDRLQRLRTKAPELISLYPDDQGRMGIATLVGTREEIAQKLNFDYTIVELTGFEPVASSM